MITPMTFMGCVLLYLRASPITLGQKLCALANACIRSFWAALIRGLSFKALLTVEIETPSSRAMSFIVMIVFSFIGC